MTWTIKDFARERGDSPYTNFIYGFRILRNDQGVTFMERDSFFPRSETIPFPRVVRLITREVGASNKFRVHSHTRYVWLRRNIEGQKKRERGQGKQDALVYQNAKDLRKLLGAELPRHLVSE